MNGNAQDRIPVRRALVSVYDKSGLGDLVRGLHEAGVKLVSTGGSAKAIEALGIPVTRVEELTGFPESFEGRVKTLHPVVHAGLLADRRLPSHVLELSDLGIEPFDLLVGNLYPFGATVAAGATQDEAVEQIDIGGPAMLRGAAKNFPSVAVVTNPASYGEVIEAVQSGGFTLQQRKQLALEVFRHTAEYDIDVAMWMGSELVPDEVVNGLPAWTATVFERNEVLRYGENPHQAAALYLPITSVGTSLAQAHQHQGKAMSHNNWLDADAAWRTVHDFADQPTVAIIKHANPCGIAIARSVSVAHRRANECDPLSAFGGVVATNRRVDIRTAKQLVAKGMFTEVLVAPGYTSGALEVLSANQNLRVLEVAARPNTSLQFRQVEGGMLVQAKDWVDEWGDQVQAWQLVAGPKADSQTLEDLQFAWRAVRSVKSNGILLAHNSATVGVGMGQVNRVDSCKLAVERAGERARGSVGASDAFFPFSDGPEVLIEAGVKAIVQPGGSMRDQLTIDLCNERGVTMYFTGTRHFAH